MRSAGCIVNDISDKEFDKKVERTKDRPIASNKVSVQLAIFYTGILCALAFLILINFNNLTIILALCSMPLAFTYPLMKRFTYWPQLFLGITFNYGLILGWICIKNQLDVVAILLYFGAIFWTLGFDTIYGFQDIKDDEIIGIKSTSIKFKKKPKLFLFLCYLIFISSLITVGFFMNFSYLFYFFSLIIVAQLIFFQIYKLDFKNPKNCLQIFKSNNFLGLLVFLNILIGKLSI
tara:strand:- start:317 stop:1018 length:702 start_codon:yes stop_codon:yes gene_type:complete